MNARDATSLVGARILVVEDDPFIAMDLEDRLSVLGAKVVGPVPAVRPALETIEAALPDAAVLDVNLRGEMSTPIAATLSLAAVPFVLVTGYSRGQLDPELREAPIVAKPVNIGALARVLSRLLRRGSGAA